MMDFSIIIVNYKVKEYIVSCIDSIYKHSTINKQFEIIVVDNCSNDGSVEAIKTNFPKVKIIQNDSNVGYAKAINQGANQASGKFILFFNPDILLKEDSLSKLITFAKKQKDLGVVGPMLVSEFDEIQQSFWRKPTLINTILSICHLDYLNYKKNYKDRKITNYTDVDCVSGAVFLTKSKIFKSLDGLNEDLFWMEDIDYCLRVKNLGYNIYLYPQTKIVHFQGKSAKQNWTITISNQLLSKIKFFRIYHSRFSAFILHITIIINTMIKVALFLVLSPFGTIYRKKMYAYIHTFRLIFYDFRY